MGARQSGFRSLPQQLVSTRRTKFVAVPGTVLPGLARSVFGASHQSRFLVQDCDTSRLPTSRIGPLAILTSGASSEMASVHPWRPTLDCSPKKHDTCDTEERNAPNNDWVPASEPQPIDGDIARIQMDFMFVGAEGTFVDEPRANATVLMVICKRRWRPVRDRSAFEN